MSSPPPFCVSSEGILAFIKEIIYTVLYVAYSMQFSVFSKNPGTTCAEIYEKQQGEKSAKSLSLTCCLEGPISAHTPSPCIGILAVERLYCKRPILCLASSKILTSHPLTARRVCTPPPLVRGENTLKILEDARHSSVIYICRYFVILVIG